jgi:hypothetical protein
MGHFFPVYRRLTFGARKIGYTRRTSSSIFVYYLHILHRMFSIVMSLFTAYEREG